MCGGAQRRRRWAALKCAAGRRQRAAAVRDSRSSNGPVRRRRGRAATIPAGRGLWPRQRRMAAPAGPHGQTRRRADDGQAYHRAAVRFRQDAVYHRYGGLRLYPRAGVHPRPVLGQGQHLRTGQPDGRPPGLYVHHDRGVPRPGETAGPRFSGAVRPQHGAVPRRAGVVWAHQCLRRGAGRHHRALCHLIRPAGDHRGQRHRP